MTLLSSSTVTIKPVNISLCGVGNTTQERCIVAVQDIFKLYRRSEVSGPYGGMYGEEFHFNGIKGLYGPAKEYSCMGVFWQANNIYYIKSGFCVCSVVILCGWICGFVH